jgi:hypothetical protein
MQEHVGCAIVRNDEAITLGSIEPLDNTADLDEIDGVAFADTRKGVECVAACVA